MREDIGKLLRRYDQAVTTKDLYRNIHEAAYEYAVPTRNLYSNKSQGAARMNKIFDSTGIKAATAFVTNMQAAITPPLRKWVKLKLGPAFDNLLSDKFIDANGVEQDKDPDVINSDREKHKSYSESLEYVTDIGFSFINASNFNSIVTEFYYDLAVGTGVLLTLPTPEGSPLPIKFVAVPIEEVAIEKGVGGSVGAIFRTHQLDARLIKQTWPEAKIPVEMAELIQSGEMQEISLIECSYTVGNITFYDVIDGKTKTRLVERQSNYNPWVVTRINKCPMDVYGSGPLVQATPDLRTLNKAKELTFRSAQLSVFGVYTVADNDILNVNNISLNPGTFIPVSRNSGPNGPSIAPLPVAGNFQAQNFFIQDLQSSIREMLFDDKLPSDTGPVRSATEIVERIKNIRKTTGIFFGPINQEFIQHLWHNLIMILVEKQVIALPPEIMGVDNFRVQIDILSPLAMEQELEDVQSLVQSWELYSTMVGPEQANMMYKMDEVGEWIAGKLGAPSKLVRSKEEREELQMQMQQAQQAQQMQEMMMQQAPQGQEQSPQEPQGLF